LAASPAFADDDIPTPQGVPMGPVQNGNPDDHPSQHTGDSDSSALGDAAAGAAQLRIPPAIVARGRGERQYWRRAVEAHDARLRVAGWAMNNMEAVSYLVAETPLHLTDPDTAAELEALARRLAEAGDIANGALRSAIGSALGVSGDKGVLETARADFYARTDDGFHALLDELADTRGEEIALRWLAVLRRVALNGFDVAAPVPLDDAEKAVKVVRARARLSAGLAGYGPVGGKLFKTLGLAPPEKRKSKGGR
jgi:CRISPR system Cascade subunit CasA